ncbi:hypothetical protein [Streptosporangium sp. NPDC049644]|uniref:hypothetical protein n=1 Tax=Streptosporangium sp. NPDC049644 TaxID=3155507 RepID=UPI003440D4F5
MRAAPYAFLKLAAGPDPTEDRPGRFDWLIGYGVPFVPKLWNEPSWKAPTGYGLMYTGGENARPFAGPVPPTARGHIVRLEGRRPGERSAGWNLDARGHHSPQGEVPGLEGDLIPGLSAAAA